MALPKHPRTCVGAQGNESLHRSLGMLQSSELPLPSHVSNGLQSSSCCAKEQVRAKEPGKEELAERL